MNQIKYLVYASLLLVFFSFVTITLQKFYSGEISRETFITIHSSSSVPTNELSLPGKSIFQTHCQTCHALDKVMTGPALRGVETRGPWTNRKILLQWVKNPAATINKFTYTKNLMKEYGGQIMPSFSQQLSDKEIEAIFDYIAKTPRVTAVPTPIALK